ncbi:thiamine pyrophosphate-dependent enzyme, partial [Micromonospora profundi]
SVFMWYGSSAMYGSVRSPKSTGRLTGSSFHDSPDFAAHARSQGCYGEQVVRAADLTAALDRARTAVARDRVPAVLDVWVPEHLTGSMDPARRARPAHDEGNTDG